MANFAREQLMKYGWTEGKGLGKDENGITEAIKPAANQNKAGLGYNEIDSDSWWEREYNNATKNVKVESHGDEVSLSVVNNTDASCSTKGYTLLRSLTNTQQRLHLYERFTKLPMVTKIMRTQLTDDMIHAACDGRTAHKTARHGLTLSGKLERIAEQDKALLDTDSKSELNANVLEKNIMIHRKANIESDVEESEHETDNNESILQSEITDFLDLKTKSSKKRQRKKMSKLALQLGSCSLEGNNPKHNSLNNRKLGQVMKKSKEGKMDSNTPRTSLKIEANDNIMQVQSICRYNDTLMKQHMRRLQVLLDWGKRKTIMKQMFETSRSRRCEDLKDSIKIELGTELGNNMNNIRDWRSREKDWVLITVKSNRESNREQKSLDHNPFASTGSSNQDDSKLKNTLDSKLVSKQKIALFPTEHMDEMETKYQSHMHRLNAKILKKKRGYRTKHIQKIADKLKGDALAHELNTVIKNLSAVGLTEEVKANAFKKKPTQTHLTSV